MCFFFGGRISFQGCWNDLIKNNFLIQKENFAQKILHFLQIVSCFRMFFLVFQGDKERLLQRDMVSRCNNQTKGKYNGT